jgi:cytochrome c oxidase assembly protein subunit 23
MASQIDAKTARLPVSRPDNHSNPDDPKQAWNADSASKFNSKSHSKYYDPCQDFANKSIRCLHRNGGDKDMCQDYFQAYRACKKEWTRSRRFGVLRQAGTETAEGKDG